MTSPKNRIPIPGSERPALPGAHALRALDPGERIEVTLRVRPRTSSKAFPQAAELGARAIGERRYLSHEELASAHGADPIDLDKIETFAHEHGLTVVERSVPRRTLRVSGTAEAIDAAFGVELTHYQHPGGTYRGHVGAPSVSAELEGIVTGVFGLDDRPVAKPHIRRLEGSAAAGQTLAAGGSFTPPQVAELYDFPKGLNGQGQTIAIIELGGGYRATDLQAYFAQLGIPKPQVSAVSVDHGHNHPTTPNSADGEVMLDIEVAGAVAPGARIVVYFAPNTDAGFLDAITTAIHDAQHKPSVISISWGGPESGWTRQAMDHMDQAFQEAAALGISVCCASGDNGSSDGVNDGLAHVDFPASSPHALACGGTLLQGSSATITNEEVWNDPGGGSTGGGVSDVFGLPTWQANAKVPPSANPGGHVGRGVPDIAGDASPRTGYLVRVDGQEFPVGGTSAVAPLWAGLIALFNQHLGKPVGYLNPLLYAQLGNPIVFHDITKGNNGVYQARPGWDACTGTGSPDGAKLMAALTGAAAAVAPER